ncbi:MAG: glycine zipper 2TM domain-containing protein [Epsilonproteobacteria bacterium]|nr:glycine zipper 2TM domain-containing protein [Campylobacterota bacterium]
MGRVVSLIIFFSLLFFTGCASRGYTTTDVGDVMVTYEGEIISARTVTISDSGEGTVLGAIIGGVLGHQVGGGKGKDVATAAGTVLGGVVGATLNRRTGQELIIRLSNNQEISTVIRVDPKRPFWFKAGDKVRVFLRGGEVVKIEPILRN